MKTLITYMSQTGNTKTISKAIYEKISGDKEIKPLKKDTISDLENHYFYNL